MNKIRISGTCILVIAVIITFLAACSADTKPDNSKLFETFKTAYFTAAGKGIETDLRTLPGFEELCGFGKKHDIKYNIEKIPVADSLFYIITPLPGFPAFTTVFFISNNSMKTSSVAWKSCDHELIRVNSHNLLVFKSGWNGTEDMRKMIIYECASFEKIFEHVINYSDWNKGAKYLKESYDIKLADPILVTGFRIEDSKKIVINEKYYIADLLKNK